MHQHGERGRIGRTQRVVLAGVMSLVVPRQFPLSFTLDKHPEICYYVIVPDNDNEKHREIHFSHE